MYIEQKLKYHFKAHQGITTPVINFMPVEHESASPMIKRLLALN